MSIRGESNGSVLPGISLVGRRTEMYNISHREYVYKKMLQRTIPPHSQCSDLCQPFLSTSKIPTKLLHYFCHFPGKAIPCQSCSGPHASTGTFLHLSSSLWLHPSLPSPAALPISKHGTCSHPSPHCSLYPATLSSCHLILFPFYVKLLGVVHTSCSGF